MLRRENHPLGVRRAEATKAAFEESEASHAHKRWTLGVAAGALLMAGTFAAGALGLHGGATPVAGAAPEHAPAAPGHDPGPGAPVVGAPVPGGKDAKQQPLGQQSPRDQQALPTTPASAGSNNGIPVVSNTGTSGGTGSNKSGDTQRTAPSGGTSTPTTQTPPSTTTPPTTTTPTQPSTQTSEPKGNGGLLGTVGGVLSPVTDVVGGILSPSTSSTDSTAATKSAPAGPALTMINPLGDLLAS
ncbi:hypothetical protein [Actinophytocola sp.]|uniref:hypothetical protein n=1 Tax=Actinophytocola sp. TaxID=1872138 RepID=UPI00389B1013